MRGARVHNLRNVDVDVPLGRIVGIAGVSGSGKSSLALGVLYSEGSRRYLESLSTYTRRRMTQATKADVDEVLYVPAALALHQRPGVPGIRSTFGTGTELLNSLRLMFSRLACHRCPNGHYVEPSLRVAAEKDLVCPVCGEHFYAPGAEDLAFNSQGACRKCDGTGTVRTVDESTLIPDENLTIDEGAVAPWNTLMWSLMKDVCRAMGVRTDVPFKDLTDREKDIVLHGPAEKKHILYKAKNSNDAAELDFTFYNATYTVENALSKVKDEKGIKRVEKFLRLDVCPDCGGTRLSDAARAPRLRGISLAEACTMTLTGIVEWVKGVPASLPEEMRPMAESICGSFLDTAKRLLDLGIGYLSLDRSAATLSTGERQRMQLARAVRNRTTGVLYVLDEPSIGLHPSNIIGLCGVMDDLIADGNSVILVDHDTQILSKSDWMIEMGPEAGSNGGTVIAQGTLSDIENNEYSRIGPYLSGRSSIKVREQIKSSDIFSEGKIRMETSAIHTVRPLSIEIPKGRLTVVTGVSGSGKTTMLNALSAFIGYNERVVTIEDTRELQLKQRIVIPRVACPPNSEGKGEFTMHELLVGALRERPDRIVVGECRDDETYEMLQAMQTGHDGSLTTIHANDCAGAFTRIENMILKSQGNMTMEAIRRQIGAAIDVVVQVKRWRGGYRRIESITAVEGFSDGNVIRNELFHWEGSPENGRHVATGYQPARLKEKILDADAEYDPRWFEGGVW